MSVFRSLSMEKNKRDGELDRKLKVKGRKKERKRKRSGRGGVNIFIHDTDDRRETKPLV